MSLYRKATQTLVRQQDQADCGIACLASLLAYYDSRTTLERLRELSGTTQRGTTLLGLRQGAQDLGFAAEGLQADSVENLKYELAGPAILHVRVSAGVEDYWLEHYLICYGWDATRHHFLVGDPAQGVSAYSAEALAAIWSSRMLLALTPTAALERQTTVVRHQRRWLAELVREDMPLLAIATGLGVVTAALGLSTALFSQKLIDTILPQRDMKRLWLGVGLLAVLLLARAGVGFLRGWLLSRQSRDFNNRLITRFFSALLYLPKSFFDHRKTGDLITRLNDTGRIQQTISYLTGTVIINLLVVVVSSVYVFSYSAAIGGLTLLSIPLYVGLAWRFQPPIVAGQRRVMAAASLNESQYVDTIRGIEVVKATGREPFFSAVTQNIYGQVQREVYQLRGTGLRFNLLAEGAGALLITGVLALTAYLVMQQQLKLGEMVAVLSMAGSIIPAVSSLALSNIQLQEARVAFERMHEYATLKPEAPTFTEPEPMRAELIEVQNISFRFPGRPLALNDISFHVRRGELIVIMGESGGGKTTLLQLLQRFYAPTAGTVLLDGVDWAAVPTTSWRHSIGIMPQQSKLFSGTLFENVCLGASAQEAEKFVTFCQKWGFDHYFASFPQGYATKLGEEGIALSGGQQQLVTLARALYSSPQLLLLDEPTAAMDEHTEQFVFQLLQRLQPHIAIVCITHKSTLAQYANRLYSLQQGQLQLIQDLPCFLPEKAEFAPAPNYLAASLPIR